MIEKIPDHMTSYNISLLHDVHKNTQKKPLPFLEANNNSIGTELDFSPKLTLLTIDCK